MVKIVSPIFDDKDKDQLSQKGIAWLTIESDSKHYDVTFYGLDRLPYEIQLEGGFIYKPNMIIIEELSFELIERYLIEMEESGQFEFLNENISSE